MLRPQEAASPVTPTDSRDRNDTELTEKHAAHQSSKVKVKISFPQVSGYLCPDAIPANRRRAGGPSLGNTWAAAKRAAPVRDLRQTVGHSAPVPE